MLYDVLMNINPVAFRIGNLEVRWYGLIITCAMVLGLIILIFMAKKKGISSDDTLELFLWVIPLGIVFARIIYVFANNKEYGYFLERAFSFGFTGIDAMDKMNKIMNDIRTSDISSVQGKKVLALSDYLTGVTTKCDGTKEKITLPKSNVLLYTLENDCWMCVRPSGTEPKLKIYLATKEDSFDSAEKDLAAMKDEVVKKFNL